MPGAPSGSLALAHRLHRAGPYRFPEMPAPVRRVEVRQRDAPTGGGVEKAPLLHINADVLLIEATAEKYQVARRQLCGRNIRPGARLLAGGAGQPDAQAFAVSSLGKA